MIRIILNDEQAQALKSAKELVELVDQNGNRLGAAAPKAVGHGFTEEDVAIALKRRESNEPGMTTKELIGYLESLDQQ